MQREQLSVTVRTPKTESKSPIETTHHHRVRRISATLLGGVGAGFLALGLVFMGVYGLVSSAAATQKSVESAISDTAIRQAIADEVVTAIEESGDTPQEKIVFSIARPLIENAVARAFETEKIQKFVGTVAFTFYEVFVDEKPAQKVDVSPLVDVGIDAIKSIDKRIAKDFTPKVDPLEIRRDADSPDLKTARDDVRGGTRAVLLLGILLQIAAWFLSVATPIVRLKRLGIRIACVGIVMVAGVFVARQVAPNFSSENADVIDAVTIFVTAPVLVRGLAVVVVGAVVAVSAWLLARRVVLSNAESVETSTT